MKRVVKGISQATIVVPSHIHTEPKLQRSTNAQMTLQSINQSKRLPSPISSQVFHVIKNNYGMGCILGICAYSNWSLNLRKASGQVTKK